jgi:hypothetical protein
MIGSEVVVRAMALGITVENNTARVQWLFDFDRVIPEKFDTNDYTIQARLIERD